MFPQTPPRPPVSQENGTPSARSNMSGMDISELGRERTNTLASALPQSAMAGPRLQIAQRKVHQSFEDDLKAGCQIDRVNQQLFEDDLKAGRDISPRVPLQDSRLIPKAFELGIKAMCQEQQAFMQQLQEALSGHQEMIQSSVASMQAQTAMIDLKLESGANGCPTQEAAGGNGHLLESEPETTQAKPSRKTAMKVSTKHQSLLAKKIDLNSQALLADTDDDAGALLKQMESVEGKGRSNTKELLEQSCYQKFQAFVEGTRFELTFGVIILINTVIMAVDMQYTGEIAGADLNYPLTNRPSAALGRFLNVVNEFLLWAFVIELICKLIAQRTQFFRTNIFFNYMDFLVVVSGVIDRFFTVGMGVDPLILRLLRMLKLTRILKMFRVSSALHTMNYIMKAVAASRSTLLWSMILIFMIQTVAGMFVVQLAASFVTNESNTMAARLDVYKYYGTFSKASFSMFEVTHVNYARAARVLTDNISEAWALFFVVYRVCIAFAFMQVVRAIFIQSTLKVADRDRDLMIHNKRAVTTQTTTKLRDFFKVLSGSADADAELTESMFLRACKLDATKIWFSALDIDLCDPPGMWELLDLNGDGSVSELEFAVAAAKLRGGAQTLDLYCLHSLTERIESKLDILLPSEFRGHRFAVEEDS